MRVKRGYGYGKAAPGLKMALEERLPSLSGGWLFQEEKEGGTGDWRCALKMYRPRLFHQRELGR